MSYFIILFPLQIKEFELLHYDNILFALLNFSRSQVHFQLIKGAEDSEVQIHSDPIHLNHVFKKLLQNALFYTIQGHVKFGYMKTADGLEFFVEDTGCGIDESSQELIFKPFFKGNNQIIGHKGFGLGLAICNGLVRLLGGKLQFTSEVSKGTRFSFLLSFTDLYIEK